ncbi:acyl-CoA N-acyltransferase [Aspergillus californicus]
MPPTILKATPAHAPSIKAIVTAAYTKYIPRIGKPPAPMLADYDELLDLGFHEIYVLTDAATSLGPSPSSDPNAVLGSIILGTDDKSDSMEINNLVVDPAAQGRGYGRLLMDFAEEKAREQGKKAVMLFTNVKMHENLGLYVRLGFVETGRREESGYERVFFRKGLD